METAVGGRTSLIEGLDQDGCVVFRISDDGRRAG